MNGDNSDNGENAEHVRVVVMPGNEELPSVEQAGDDHSER